jgi:tRNA A-37 threonylcarbamoyl transferase component Bud32
MAVAETHPSAEELAAFTLGTLGEDAHAAIEAHVASCTACQERAAVAPGDALVELLRCAHARTGHPVDTVSEAVAQAQTPAPLPADVVAVRPAPTVTMAAPAGSDCPPIIEAVPAELADHERYRVVRLLGAGGMGAVFEAEHRVLHRPVALKVINRAYTARPAAVERFRREVRAAARLSHPNIVTTHDAEDAGATHFLVMEYVEGVSLGRLVKERGPLPVAEACACVRQAALGLQHAHERGMVHRDVKPDNLIRCADGTVKVLDFGLAVLTAERGGSLTDTNVIMGTADYMAPEQAEDARTADIRADVYSLGCTLYYLLTGKVPYPAPTSVLKILAHREQPLPSIRQACPAVPPELAAVMARLLAKRPEDRYATPGEVAAALEPFTVGGAAPPPRHRWPLLAALAAVLLVAVTLAGAVYRIQTDKGELVITTERDDVKVVITQGGKEVDIIDTKKNKQISLKLRTGVYELELQGAPKGLKLNIEGKVTLTRGETVLAKIERVAKKTPEKLPVAEPGKIEVVRRIPVSGARDLLYHTAISKGGKYALVTRDINPGVRLDVFNVDTGEETFDCPGYFAEFLNDEQLVVDGDMMFRVYQARTGKLVRQGPHRELCGMRVAAGGKHLVYFDCSGRPYLYDLVKMREVHAWENIGIQGVPFFSPDGKRLLMRLKDKPWTCWDVENNCPAKDCGGLEGVTEVWYFFPDGKTAAVTRNGELVRLELRTGKVVGPLKNGPATPGVLQGEYSRDGRCFVARFQDGRFLQYRTPFGGKALGRYQLPPDDR